MLYDTLFVRSDSGLASLGKNGEARTKLTDKATGKNLSVAAFYFLVVCFLIFNVYRFKITHKMENRDLYQAFGFDSISTGRIRIPLRNLSEAVMIDANGDKISLDFLKDSGDQKVELRFDATNKNAIKENNDYSDLDTACVYFNLDNMRITPDEVKALKDEKTNFKAFAVKKLKFSNDIQGLEKVYSHLQTLLNQSNAVKAIENPNNVIVSEVPADATANANTDSLSKTNPTKPASDLFVFLRNCILHNKSVINNTNGSTTAKINAALLFGLLVVVSINLTYTKALVLKMVLNFFFILVAFIIYQTMISYKGLRKSYLPNFNTLGKEPEVNYSAIKDIGAQITKLEIDGIYKEIVSSSDSPDLNNFYQYNGTLSSFAEATLSNNSMILCALLTCLSLASYSFFSYKETQNLENLDECDAIHRLI
jgi:hypothetical protein